MIKTFSYGVLVCLEITITLIEDIDFFNFLSLGSTLFTALQEDFESSFS